MKSNFKKLLKHTRHGNSFLLFTADAVVVSLACYSAFSLHYISNLIGSMNDFFTGLFIVTPMITVVLKGLVEMVFQAGRETAKNMDFLND